MRGRASINDFKIVREIGSFLGRERTDFFAPIKGRCRKKVFVGSWIPKILCLKLIAERLVRRVLALFPS